MSQFSIVITCFNQAKFIDDAISSALSQHYRDKEIIVVDDCSDDGSDAILKKYVNAARVVRPERNMGASRARNLGAAAATGEYLVFLDGDDLLLPWALDVYAQVLRRQDVAVILGSLLWFEGQPPKPRPEDFPRNVKFVAFQPLIKKDRPNRSSASATVIHQRTFQEVQGWTSDMFPFEDFEILVKLSPYPATQILSPPTTSYRVHDTNSIHRIGPFVRELRGVIEKIKRAEYPCSRSYRLESYAFVGGPALYWVKRAYSCGQPAGALRLLASGWALILAALIYKSRILLKGRRRSEVIPMEWNWDG
jgi:glycosyltransferase involved in cell wall biosynthesis